MKKILTETELKKHIYKKVLSMLNEDNSKKMSRDKMIEVTNRLLLSPQTFEDNTMDICYSVNIIHDLHNFGYDGDLNDENKTKFKIRFGYNMYDYNSYHLLTKGDFKQCLSKVSWKLGEDRGFFDLNEIEDSIKKFNKRNAIKTAKKFIKDYYGFLSVDEEYDKLIEDGVGIYGRKPWTIYNSFFENTKEIRLSKNLDMFRWKLSSIKENVYEALRKGGVDHDEEVENELGDVLFKLNKAIMITQLTLNQLKAQQQEKDNEEDIN